MRDPGPLKYGIGPINEVPRDTVEGPGLPVMERVGFCQYRLIGTLATLFPLIGPAGPSVIKVQPLSRPLLRRTPLV